MKSVLSEKVVIKDSGINRRGMFADNLIRKGEFVFAKGGHIVKRDEIFSDGVINSYHPIGNGYYLAAIAPEEEEQVKLYINHSCNTLYRVQLVTDFRHRI